MGRSVWTHGPTAGPVPARVRRRRISEQIELLRRAPLFAGLSKTNLRVIADVSSARRFSSGDVLVKQGAAGAVLYVIVEGEAKVVRNRRVLKTFGPGDLFGEMSVLTGAPRSASVVAETEMECLTLSGRELRRVLEVHPAMAQKMLVDIAGRLEEADKLIS